MDGELRTWVLRVRKGVVGRANHIQHRARLRKLGPAGRKGPDANEFDFHWL